MDAGAKPGVRRDMNMGFDQAIVRNDSSGIHNAVFTDRYAGIDVGHRKNHGASPDFRELRNERARVDDRFRLAAERAKPIKLRAAGFAIADRNDESERPNSLNRARWNQRDSEIRFLTRLVVGDKAWEYLGCVRGGYYGGGMPASAEDYEGIHDPNYAPMRFSCNSKTRPNLEPLPNLARSSSLRPSLSSLPSV